MKLKNIFTKYLKKFSKNNNFTMHRTSSVRDSGEILNFSQNKENIKIGKNSIIKGRLIVFAHSGKIEIGDDTIINHNVEIWSAKHIFIGSRVQIGHNSNIIDTDAHPIDSKLRHEHLKEILTKGFNSDKESNINKNIRSTEIVIKDDSWIGIGSFIQRGVTVEKEAIVSPMSYVIEDVPKKSVVFGNPAKILKYYK